MQNSSKTLFNLISTDFEPKHIAVIGSGGKTGTILKLAEELSSLGKKVLITTTTKMWLPKEAVAQSAEAAFEHFKTRHIVWAGTILEKEGKITALPKEEQAVAEKAADIILTEADGSRGFPLKCPEGNEPVLPKTADYLIVVLGMDCLDKPLLEVCHHAKRIPYSLICEEEETVTPKLAAKLLTEGYLKRLPPLPFTILLNASKRQPKEEKVKELVLRLPQKKCVLWTKDRFISLKDSKKQLEKLRFGAVLMAAGLGRRFGGDKLFARIDGQTLIEKTLHVLPAAAFEEVVVVAKEERILSLARKQRFSVIVNEHPEEGIGRTIRLGTERMKDMDAAMYLVCDQPYLSKDTVQALIHAAEETPEKIIVPEAGGKWGNPCIFPKRFFSDLRTLEGDIGGKSIIRKHPECVKCINVPKRELLDIDKKEDLMTEL